MPNVRRMWVHPTALRDERKLGESAIEVVGATAYDSLLELAREAHNAVMGEHLDVKAIDRLSTLLEPTTSEEADHV